MSIVKQFIDKLKIKGRAGKLPTVTPCPFCGRHLSQTEHAAHRKPCAQAFQDAPPQQPAEFSQDAGGGYNPGGTFPQT